MMERMEDQFIDLRSHIDLPLLVTHHDLISGEKGFSDGPNLPPTTPDTPENFGIDVRSDKEVIPGEWKQLQEFVKKLPETGTHGLTINKDVRPQVGRYDENIHYLVESRLGKGSFGSVDMCNDKSSKKKFVRKRVKRQVFRSSEVIVPLNVDHVNLTKVYGLIQREVDRDYMLELLLEFAGQSLIRWIQDRDVTEDQIWDVMKQGLSGLAQLDRYWIVHLDIKPENLCIQTLPDGKLLIKITDFGSAKLPSEGLHFIGNTPEYLPAEMCKLFLQLKHGNLGLDFGLDESAVTGKVDVFALALTVMFMYKKYHILQKLITKGETSYAKYDKQTRQAMQQQLMVTMVQNADLVEKLIPDEVDLDMRDLLSRMVKYDYTKRDSPAQALKFVEERERRLFNARLQSMAINRTSLAQRLQHQIILQPEVNYESGQQLSGDIPNTANCVADFESGPIRKDRRRSKLGKPYGKGGKGKVNVGSEDMREDVVVYDRRHGKGRGKKMIKWEKEPLKEVKTLVQDTYGVTAVPNTPVEDMRCLAISGETWHAPSSIQSTSQKVLPRDELSFPFQLSDVERNIPEPLLNLGLQPDDKFSSGWMFGQEEDCKMPALEEGLEEGEFISIMDQSELDPLYQSSVQIRDDDDIPAGNLPNFNNLDW